MFCAVPNGRYSVSALWILTGVADVFLTAFCDVRPVRILERDTNGDTSSRPIRENREDSGVFGQEQRAVSQDGDLMLG